MRKRPVLDDISLSLVIAREKLMERGCSLNVATGLIHWALMETLGSTELPPGGGRTTTMDEIIETFAYKALQLDGSILAKHGITIDRRVYSRARKSSRKHTRCQICGEEKKMVSYEPRWPNGAIGKCLIDICDDCLPEVKRRHPDITYITLDEVFGLKKRNDEASKDVN